jgi:hypothetical protein
MAKGRFVIVKLDSGDRYPPPLEAREAAFFRVTARHEQSWTVLSFISNGHAAQFIKLARENNYEIERVPTLREAEELADDQSLAAFLGLG